MFSHLMNSSHLHIHAGLVSKAIDWSRRAWIAWARPGTSELALLNDHLLRDMGLESVLHEHPRDPELEKQMLRRL